WNLSSGWRLRRPTHFAVKEYQIPDGKARLLAISLENQLLRRVHDGALVPDRRRLDSSAGTLYDRGSQKVCDNGVGIPLTGGVSMSKSKKITVDQLVAAMPTAINRAVKDQENRPQGTAELTPIVGFLPND
ncbi:MAG TPA: hypothetical protein VKM72_20620, partial [Thermoanaerobaculia bacterium]|nr:hypothetical protein [Thermoanaerobaculia bacterium]